ncbi:hypothetical protein LINGRAHAP2_LOCUS33825 [Linum grandiflorum]
MATSSKLGLYFIVSLLLLGAINAQPTPPYRPTGEWCRNVSDCHIGLYCVCDHSQHTPTGEGVCLCTGPSSTSTGP